MDCAHVCRAIASRADCRSTCSAKGMVCHEDFFSDANTCQAMQRSFGCKSCSTKSHAAAPAQQQSSGTCLLNDHKRHFDCEGAAEGYIRLCICVLTGDVYAVGDRHS
uniref:Glycosyltransferase family 18 catalytic domain-containing protein n=1 Tax=Lotharella globosa TaxID=91324 RepID=A0A7S4DE47_9EUKA